MQTFEDKHRHVIHFKTLKLYLSLGLELKSVHHLLSFKQCAWLKPFFVLSTRQIQLAVINFEKELFKLMNYAVYGKLMENVRNRVNFCLVSNECRFRKLVSTQWLISHATWRSFVATHVYLP